ncbi:hypothetical protein ACFW16_31650 [Inquilinus sp. NPDC058860]|uniref:hypothetical protein n=1 Tax=Inquilinus sp. NPDC058860 TaxID=3346652 RepID=UPI0036989457
MSDSYVTNLLGAFGLTITDEVEAAGAGEPLYESAHEAVVLIANNGGRSLDWLRRRLDLTHSGAVRLADRLQHDGLLSRSRSGREVALDLTPAGRAMVARLTEARIHALAALLAPLDADDRAQLVRIMDQMLCAKHRRRADADRGCRRCDWASCGDRCPISRSVSEG